MCLFGLKTHITQFIKRPKIQIQRKKSIVTAFLKGDLVTCAIAQMRMM